MSSSYFNINKNDLEHIAKWGEEESSEVDRIKDLSNWIALEALNKFVQEQKKSSQIEKQFLERVDRGLIKLHDILVEVKQLQKENQDIIKKIHLHKDRFKIDSLKLNRFEDLKFDGNLKEYKKQVQKLRIELAKLCALQNPQAATFIFPSFKINQEIDRIEIAKLYAQRYPYIISFLEDFEIKNISSIFEIIKVCANTNGFVTIQELIQNSKHLEILKQYPDDFIEIFKLCATNDGRVVSHMSALKISNQVNVFEILKLCIPTAPFEVIEHLHEFNLSKTDESTIKFLCLKQNYKVLELLYKGISREKLVDEILSNYQISCPKYISSLLAPLIRHPDETQEEFDRREEHRTDIVEMVAALLTLADQKLSKAQIEKLLNGEILPAIMQISRPDLKWRFLLQTIEFVKSGSDIFSEREKKSSWQQILSMLLNRCYDGKDDSQIKKIAKITEHSFFKDGKQQQIILEALLLFTENDEISASAKQKLLTKLLVPSEKAITGEVARELGRQSAYLISLLSINNKNLLLDDLIEKRSLPQLVQDSLEELLSFQAIPDFVNKYEMTFGKSRIPQAICVYAGKLSHLHAVDVMQDLVTFISSVLFNNSREVRHDLAHNRHLKFIQSKNPTILNRWFQDLPIKNLSAEGREVVVMETEDPIDLLLLGTEVPNSCQTIYGFPHLNQGLLGYLLDGKIRPIVIKSKEGPEGKILGRALLKLLWDGEKPVLYLEQLYLSKKSPLFERAIIEMAKDKAKSLGVELVGSQGNGKKYERALQSFGGPAVSEYSDANLGVQFKGIYKIANAYRL